MSHFVVYVIADNGMLEKLGIEGSVEELLKDYDENTQVEGYEKECYCIEHSVRMQAHDEAEAKVGTNMKKLRDSFHAVIVSPEKSEEWKSLMMKAEPTKEDRKRLDELNAEKEAMWQAHIEPYQTALKEAEERLRKTAKPDPKCEDCDGTGKYICHYNPKSKWDWWSIGGRWSGLIRESIEPDEEGMFNGEVGENTASVSDLLRKFDKAEDEYDKRGLVPYALVTPDGKWHQKGDMGWWGMSSNDKEEDKWSEEVETLLRDNADATVIGVDCHI